MKKDNIDTLFDRMKGKLDIYEPSENHQETFLEKLQQQNKVVPLSPKKQNWYRPLAIAASIAVLIAIGSSAYMFNPAEEAELASISPQMQETQSFFTTAIQYQLGEINKVSSTDTQKLVTDVMVQLEKLESDYDILKKDLVRSGNDKSVISAMIKNFQKRTSLLEEVLQKMNNINDFKLSENENLLL